MRTKLDYLIDITISIVIVFAFLCSLLAFTTMNSNKVFAAEEFRTEFTGCDKFSKRATECSFLLTELNVLSVNKVLNFKTNNHEAAFWLGFSISNYSECPTLWPTFKGSAAPKDLFHQYFSKEINIGDGALGRVDDAPYALAFFAGEGLFYEVLDNYGRHVACEMIIDAIGPKGKIASLLKVSP